MTGHHIEGGLLIVFEGIDGSGKSTQARRLEKALALRGYDVVLTKEPTHGPFGEKIRRSFREGRLPRAEELEAFIEDRKAHVAGVITPALRRGAIIVCDRYFVSTAAYQADDLAAAEDILVRNEKIATIPDRVFFIDVPVELGAKRVERRGGANTFEGRAVLEGAAAIFRALSRPYIERIDGTVPLAESSARVLRSTEALIASRSSGGDRTQDPRS